jgi:hypothetical protein
MSKNVFVNDKEYKGVSVIQLKTADGVAQFRDIDEATVGGLNFADKGRIEITPGGSAVYWRDINKYDALYTPAHDYGILLIDWEGTHAGADSINGIQTQMFVYTPTAYRYVGYGYRSGNSAQMDSRINGSRTTATLREDEKSYGNGNMYVGYVNTNATACAAKEAQLEKEQADILMAILSGCNGYAG